MKDFILQYGICIILSLVVIALIAAILIYYKKMGELPFTGIIQYKREKKAFDEIISFGYLSDEELTDEMKAKCSDGSDPHKLFVHITKHDEILHWDYLLNHVYQIGRPKVYFAICANKKGDKYLLIDRDSKGGCIEAEHISMDRASIKGLKIKDEEVSVVLEIKKQK